MEPQPQENNFEQEELLVQQPILDDKELNLFAKMKRICVITWRSWLAIVHLWLYISITKYLDRRAEELKMEEKMKVWFPVFRKQLCFIYNQLLVATQYFDAETFVLMLISALLSILTLWLFFKKSRKTLMSLRGIKFEAMVEGSHFVKGDIPKYQVAILKAGLLRDVHVGFGIRVNDFLVVPSHVINEVGNDLLLKKNGKIQVSIGQRIISDYVSDLAYLPISSTVWASLGVTRANLAKESLALAAMATVTGNEGQTTGLLRKCAIPFFYTYTASTVPGMSGAAYVSNNMVHAVHCGVVGEHNSAISTVVVLKELSKIMKGEAVAATSISSNIDMQWMPDIDKVWHDDIFDKYVEEKENRLLNARAKHGDKYNPPEQGWAAMMDYDDDFAETYGESFNVGKNPRSPMKVRITPQGIIDSDSDIDVFVQRTTDAKPTRRLELEDRIANTEDGTLTNLHLRIKRLEQKVFQVDKCEICGAVTNQIAKHMKTFHGREEECWPCEKCSTVCKTKEKLERHLLSHPERPTCDRCGITCRTQLTLLNHRNTCLPKVAFNKKTEKVTLVGESAIPADFKTVVKVDKNGFLGKKGSQKKDSRSSKTTLNLSGEKDPLTSQLEFQSEMLKSQSAMLKLLRDLAQNMNGQNLDIMQN
ncbi:hypothetical protein 1 [Hubei sobemo-like virus 19]|uniref:hypothetical protein 1 n=1 Tax=Hubei sobemo-like virus 19 TaxID=1923204 RepID=UPI00090B7064|nr:hypothetical protein 1 [Hubei sobemo-like virus 19]APG75810.1 hypothetical protein 1 [Hubei sobemo-like virus 19]